MKPSEALQLHGADIRRVVEMNGAKNPRAFGSARVRWLRLRRHGSIFWRLSWAERGWLMQAWLMLPGVALALRWVSFQGVYGFLGRWPSGSDRALDDEGQVLARTRATVRLVQGAAAWSVHHPTCLHRSLTLWWLLRRQGVASELRIGVRKEQGRFEAHAWVERQGVALNDGLEVNLRFAAFQSFLTFCKNTSP